MSTIFSELAIGLLSLDSDSANGLLLVDAYGIACHPLYKIQAFTYWHASNNEAPRIRKASCSSSMKTPRLRDQSSQQRAETGVRNCAIERACAMARMFGGTASAPPGNAEQGTLRR